MVDGNFRQRRAVITGLLTGVIGTLAAGTFWPLWRYLNPKEEKGAKGTVSIPRSQVPVGGAHFFHFEGHTAVLLQPSPGDFTALSAVCTHLGCIVEWRPERGVLFCPCHAGVFSTSGKVLSGPPPRPLPSYPVEVVDGEVRIG